MSATYALMDSTCCKHIQYASAHDHTEPEATQGSIEKIVCVADQCHCCP